MQIRWPYQPREAEGDACSGILGWRCLCLCGISKATSMLCLGNWFWLLSPHDSDLGQLSFLYCLFLTLICPTHWQILHRCNRGGDCEDCHHCQWCKMQDTSTTYPTSTCTCQLSPIHQNPQSSRILSTLQTTHHVHCQSERSSLRWIRERRKPLWPPYCLQPCPMASTTHMPAQLTLNVLHKCLGHPGLAALQQMIWKGLLKGIDVQESCMWCMY